MCNWFMKFRKGTNNQDKKLFFYKHVLTLILQAKYMYYYVTHTIDEPLEIYTSQILIANSLY